MPEIGVGSQMVLLFFVMLFLRLPVAFALGLSAIYAMWQIGFGLEMAGDLITAGIAKYSLLAIPFFILAGSLMGTVGIAERIIRFFRVLIGGLPGGMGVVGTVVCLFWGSVSGSGPASVAAIGPLIIQGMHEDGYSRAFAAALVCTGAALSIVIPPSIGLVVFGVIAETSISQLFIAAIIPGLVCGVLMLGALPFARWFGGAPAQAGGGSLARLSPAPYAGLPYLRRLGRAFVDAFWGLVMPLIILGGIYTGAFTATEAAIVATVYALVVGVAIYRTLNLQTLFESFADASASSAMVMLVVAYASLFGWVIAVDDLVTRYSGWLLGISSDEAVVLGVVLLVVLIAGMFMDAITIMFITLPIFLPIMREFDWDPVWFGVTFMIALAIGLITPPVGINLFVAANITRLSLQKIAFAVLPFLVASIIGLVIVAAVPELSAYLVQALREGPGAS